LKVPLPLSANVVYKETFVMPHVNPDKGVKNSDRHTYPPILKDEAKSKRNSKQWLMELPSAADVAHPEALPAPKKHS